MSERGEGTDSADHPGPLTRWRARHAAQNAALAEADARIPSATCQRRLPTPLQATSVRSMGRYLR